MYHRPNWLRHPHRRFREHPILRPQSTSPLSVGPSQTAGALPQASSACFAIHGHLWVRFRLRGPSQPMAWFLSKPLHPSPLRCWIDCSGRRQARPIRSLPTQSRGRLHNRLQPSMLGFGPPSVRGAGVQPRFAGNVDSGLPRPATPDQISNGFGLNSPGQSQPETIPVPGNPEPSPPQRPRPKTAAEAMRPITERSEVSALSQEEVPTPQGEPEPYQSRRATSPPAFPSAAKRGFIVLRHAGQSAWASAGEIQRLGAIQFGLRIGGGRSPGSRRD